MELKCRPYIVIPVKVITQNVGSQSGDDALGGFHLDRARSRSPCAPFWQTYKLHHHTGMPPLQNF